MTPNEYQSLAMSTSVEHDHPLERLANALLGIVGEAGEVASLFQDVDADPSILTSSLAMIATHGDFYEVVKKYQYHGKTLPDDFSEIAFAATHASSTTPFWVGLLNPDTPPIPLGVEQGVTDEEDRMYLLRELGDLLWYVTQATDALGFTLEEVMHENINKLRKRYPNGFPVINRESRMYDE